MGKFCINKLVKFGQKEHLEALLNDGVIYMNNIEYFRKYEESQPDHLRGDRYECFDYISQNNKILCFNEMASNSTFEVNDATVFENRNMYIGYLCCMYAVYSDKVNTPIDKRMLDFGDYAVVIHNPNEFMHRIKEYGKEKNLYPNCFPVKYYDEKTKIGPLHAFMKRNKYSYQSEARIYIHSYNPQEYMILSIGSIRDIAYMVKLKK